MKLRMTALAMVFAALAVPAAAEFEKIDRQDQFASMVSGKELTRFGIKLTVSPAGDIQGSAFGRSVRGSWQWQDGYFCRDLFWGTQEIGYNCQHVASDGATLRFTSDRGAGQSADLVLK